LRRKLDIREVISVNNIVKHAEATAAKFVLQSAADKITISIQDNGKGFDFAYATEKSKSLGLRTMQERVSAIGGKLIFAKNEEKGTFIKIIIPKNA
jgi:signal transduction histidine kinase